MSGGFKRLAGIAAGVAMLVGASGCELKDDGDNLVAGKQAFIQKCGSCHALKRAGTTGVTGPDLDEAFQRARRDGFGESTFAGIVYRQIGQPARNPQTDPASRKRSALMPADLVKGETAQDVAAYVASAAARSGEDPGALARVGVKRSSEIAKEDDGVLTIPADPGGGLAYTFGGAEAAPGELTLQSKNDSQIDHNIAVEGEGVDEKGPVVKGGGVSEISFSARAGTYTFYCSVPGHREGGMLGKLTVK